MKIQANKLVRRFKSYLALDDVSHDDAVTLLDRLQQDIDIVEIGTPLLMRYGMGIVRDVKARFRGLELLCDAKIMDAAGFEAELAYDAGADYVTVLAVTDDLSVAACGRAARERGRKVMADMICVADLPGRARILQELGADVKSKDSKGYTFLHAAAFVGYNDVITYLVSHGADVKARASQISNGASAQTAKSGEGDTVADMANGWTEKVLQFPETVALLRKMGSDFSDRCFPFSVAQFYVEKAVESLL